MNSPRSVTCETCRREAALEDEFWLPAGWLTGLVPGQIGQLFACSEGCQRGCESLRPETAPTLFWTPALVWWHDFLPGMDLPWDVPGWASGAGGAEEQDEETTGELAVVLDELHAKIAGPSARPLVTVGSPGSVGLVVVLARDAELGLGLSRRLWRAGLAATWAEDPIDAATLSSGVAPGVVILDPGCELEPQRRAVSRLWPGAKLVLLEGVDAEGKGRALPVGVVGATFAELVGRGARRPGERGRETPNGGQLLILPTHRGAEDGVQGR